MCKPDLRSVSEQPAMDRWGSSSQLLGSWTTLAPARPVPRGPAYNIYIIINITSIALKYSGGPSSEAQQNKIINHIQEPGTYYIYTGHHRLKGPPTI